MARHKPRPVLSTPYNSSFPGRSLPPPGNNFLGCGIRSGEGPPPYFPASPPPLSLITTGRVFIASGSGGRTWSPGELLLARRRRLSPQGGMC